MAHTCHSENCDHSDDGPNRGAEYTLYLQIDSHKVRCLNTNSNDEGYKVFKVPFIEFNSRHGTIGLI
jgi:hypothetical protein